MQCQAITMVYIPISHSRKLPIAVAVQQRHATDVLCLAHFVISWHVKLGGFGHAIANLSHAADGSSLVGTIIAPLSSSTST
jgi:hypothetical protein